ncbi:hypothetical protein ABFY27_05935 [Akkermansia massiliensis]
MELQPYRILVAVPKALDEALVTVPLVRALKAVRRDMQVNVICPSAQAGVWKAVPEVTHVLPHASLKQLREALAADEFYNDGPLDLGVMLDQDMETLKALEPYGPMMFSGLDTHPGARKYKFRVKAPVLRAAPPCTGFSFICNWGAARAGCLESVPVPGEKGGCGGKRPHPAGSVLQLGQRQ